MVAKKDWEKILKDNEDQKELMEKSFATMIPQFEAVIKVCKDKIAEFPEEDPMPEGTKELLGVN